MEETLGKRIVRCRKGLGLTQDQLAERLGVTAQAVSKWENDQSCPDISTLPKLAEIFSISIDALLGCEQPKQVQVHEAEVVTTPIERDELENEGLHYQNGNWEFRYDGGKKSSIGIALWVLLVGSLLLASNILDWNTGVWSIIWPSGLLIFGLFGLYPKFSVFRLGCALAGAYYLLTTLGVGFFSQMGKEYILPIGILLLGLSLLIDALRKPKRPGFYVHHNGRNVLSGDSGKHHSSFTVEDESFNCDLAFGSNTRCIGLPRLRGGSAGVSFGELTVDLTAVEEIAENCRIKADCSFGELIFRVPRRWRVETNTSTTFASIDIKGHPAADPEGVILMDADVSFGQITIEYI